MTYDWCFLTLKVKPHTWDGVGADRHHMPEMFLFWRMCELWVDSLAVSHGMRVCFFYPHLMQCTTILVTLHQAWCFIDKKKKNCTKVQSPTFLLAFLVSLFFLTPMFSFNIKCIKIWVEKHWNLMLSTPLTQIAESTAVISELCVRGDVFLSFLCLTGSVKKRPIVLSAGLISLITEEYYQLPLVWHCLYSTLLQRV